MKNKTVGVRINSEDHDLLAMVCNARGEDLSDFVRRAVKKELASLSFYNEETKKALGLSKGAG